MSHPDAADQPIESIDNFGYCEDERTFMLKCQTVDGRTLYVSACPGEPLSVHIDGEPSAKPRVLNS